jgi:hypothetical protein
MKRLIAAIVLCATTAVAQETKKEDEYNTIREYKNKVFSIQNREPNAIASAVKLLGSGFRGAGLSVNSELRTITIRDFPENIAAIEEAIKRLDRPVAQTPEIEMKISVLIGSKTAVTGPAVPDDLSSVVKQLQSTLTYPNYGLMTTTVHRTRAGIGIEGSGVAEPTLLGMTAVQERPIFYTYQARGITLGSSESPTVGIDNFEFAMQVPLDVGNSGVQYRSVGFKTPVTLRQKEKVVIGTTTMRDKVLIVVLMANANQ